MPRTVLGPRSRAHGTPGRFARPGRWAAEAAARARVREGRYRKLLTVADGVSTVVGIVVWLQVLGRDAPVVMVLLTAAGVVVGGKVAGLYGRDQLVMRKSTLDEAPKLLQVAGATVLALWLLEGRGTLADLRASEAWALLAALFVALVSGRAVARRLARRVTTPERCLLMGDPTACARISSRIARSEAVHANIVTELSFAEFGNGEVPLELLRRTAHDHGIQRVIIAPHGGDDADVLALVRAVVSLGLQVSVLPRVLEVVGSAVVVDDLDGLLVLGVRRFGLDGSARVVKRATDVLGAVAGMVILSPVLAAIAIAVKLDSSGPVIFRQARVGRDGHAFWMFKFRTMGVGAEGEKVGLLDRNELPGLFKVSDDPRVTRVGRFLRRTSLDELPQLLNVLRGDMSLVGPRPLIVEEDSRITGWDRRRLHLTPGMTGPWQVTGQVRMPLDEMVKLDYLYVASWSLWGDVKLLLRTLAFVARRRGW